MRPPPPSDEWASILFSFGWLRHLRAAESAITRANARALVEEWMAMQGSWHPVAWRPEIIARRIIVSASEDIGLADPEALKLAIAAREAYRMLGPPEGYLALSQMTLYLATAPKSNRS